MLTMGLDSIVYLLHEYWVDTNEHIKDYPLIGGGPGLIILIMLSWLLFVTKLGPNFMRNRKPFVLRKIMIAYNLVLVVINAYFIYTSFKWLEFGRKSWNPRLPPSNQWSQKAIQELPEKSNQVSMLHVYHHFIVPIMGYLVVKQCPQTFVVEMFCFLNSCVHLTMYSYYLLSAFGPQIQPYLWWKRYITRLQLIQFALWRYE
ncbi:unnamed protein product [Oppiella nova]|uniref:Elongation of very long chain fatty acids protein n=1 Tax=Oppiella nova TaxID=334625 RepID=A0A7R9MN76_9ACAR|nr:unnamed protein product [Oppiella nova]CAG2179617.1 unnamed protein product [Oppiella nova]